MGEAAWRRIRLIPFPHYFAPDVADPELIDKLLVERAGILAWAIDGARAWYSERLGACETVAKATSEYRSESDILADFLDEATERGQFRTTPSILYLAYKRWCESGGQKPMSMTAFGRRLGEKGIDQIRGHKNRFYLGLRPVGETGQNEFET